MSARPRQAWWKTALDVALIVVALFRVVIGYSVDVAMTLRYPLALADCRAACASAMCAFNCRLRGALHLDMAPYVQSGVVGATMLGLGRALGETIAVLMVIGNDPHYIGTSLFHQGETVPAVIDASSATQIRRILTKQGGSPVLFRMTLDDSRGHSVAVEGPLFFVLGKVDSELIVDAYNNVWRVGGTSDYLTGESYTVEAMPASETTSASPARTCCSSSAHSVPTKASET